MAAGRGPAGDALEQHLHWKLKKGGASAGTPRPLEGLGVLCWLHRQAALDPQSW
jgi:hypothetical protein